jgi:hypothetical protein
MACVVCQRAIPTAQVSLLQNIGMIAVRSHRNIKGQLCRSCSARFFWEFSQVTLALGWWGLISFFITPIALVNNVIQFRKTRRLPPAPPEWRSASGSPVCPRCKAPALQPEKWSAQPLVALVVSGLLLVWGGYLILNTSTPAAANNRVVGSVILVIALSAIGAFVMLQRQRLRICQHCQLTVPAE